MHKDGKWARQIIALQEEDGKWGCFHSLSQFYGASITTEQALGRLERLGYTAEDDCIRKVLCYMDDCLTGKTAIPDRREKVHDWDVFTSLILATRIRRFTLENINANRVAEQWAEVATATFAGGAYNHEVYTEAYRDILKPNGGRFVQLANFYPVSLLQGCLNEQTEIAFVQHLLHHDGGIYYIYDKKIAVLPQAFASREASRYLAAIELLAKYQYARYMMGFVADWLNMNRNQNGKWDMGKAAADRVYFPLSDNWRRQEIREADCTERIQNLLSELL